MLGEPSFGKLIDEYLHDFDIFHLAHATELLHYIDPKYLSVELGGNRYHLHNNYKLYLCAIPKSKGLY